MAYIDDVVLPISWKIKNEYNNNFYFSVLYEGVCRLYKVQIKQGNYNGTSFSAALELAINAPVDSD